MTSPPLSGQDLVQLRLGHLGMIQSIATRIAGYSATIKGLCVTVTAGVISLAVDNLGVLTLPVLGILVIAFAGLDSYYLGLERHFVGVYREVASRPLATAPDLRIDPPISSLRATLRALRSASVAGFYLPLLVAVGSLALVVTQRQASPALAAHVNEGLLHAPPGDAPANSVGR